MMANLEAYAPTLVAAAEGGGLHFNFDPLETNAINLLLILGILYYFGRRFLGNILSQRRSRIEGDIQQAEQRASDAAATLADAQKKLEQAQDEAQRIRESAQQSAQNVKQRILDETDREIERMRQSAVQDVDAERDRAVREIRERVAALAMERAEQQLRQRLDASLQQKLIDRSLAQLGGKQ